MWAWMKSRPKTSKLKWGPCDLTWARHRPNRTFLCGLLYHGSYIHLRFKGRDVDRVVVNLRLQGFQARILSDFPRFYHLPFVPISRDSIFACLLACQLLSLSLSLYLCGDGLPAISPSSLHQTSSVFSENASFRSGFCLFFQSKKSHPICFHQKICSAQ